jgi:hypothetical protein
VAICSTSPSIRRSANNEPEICLPPVGRYNRVIYYVRKVNRQELIAALDAEIARLQHARLLIARSVVHRRPSKRPAQQLASTKSRQRVISRAAQESLAPPPRERRLQPENEAAVPFTRVPAKQAPRPRVSRTVSKHPTALTGNVPTEPVAVPSKNSRQSAAGAEADLPTVAPAASAFGQAIARGLATLHG